MLSNEQTSMYIECGTPILWFGGWGVYLHVRCLVYLSEFAVLVAINFRVTKFIYSTFYSTYKPS